MEILLILLVVFLGIPALALYASICLIGKLLGKAVVKVKVQ